MSLSVLMPDRDIFCAARKFCYYVERFGMGFAWEDGIYWPGERKLDGLPD